jgi:hydrogenase-4 component F
MRLIALWALPALAGVVSYVVPARLASRIRPAILVGAAGAHLGLVVTLWVRPAPPAFNGWLDADALGLLVLTLASLVFFLTALYAVEYMQIERARGGRVFVAGLLAFLAAATIVTLSQHLALLWVGMEASTLALAPLVFHRHDRRSLEAVWKYLLISSVGIALALFGIFLVASAQAGVGGRALLVGDLMNHATELDAGWLRVAFLFLLVGFGTKMGLAPMHTWKPDTYGEAPSLVSGLMAGVLTSCAFLGVARITGVAMAAGLGPFAQPILIGFGLLSLAVAAGFIIGQSDVKRLLAYSSVEHMGLLVLGLGFGGMGAYGSVLHMLNNGLSKSWLFLVAGNIVLATGSSAIAANRGLVRTLPVSGALLVLGLFAVTGSPPFGLFISEFTLLRAAIGAGHPWIAGLMLMLLAVIFVGMAKPLLEMALGGKAEPDAEVRESRWLVLGPIVLAATVLMLGMYIPTPLENLLANAAASLGGFPP